MEEKFNSWNKDKINIELSCKDNIFINVRDIWFTKMGINIGFEENGKKEFRRPILVLKKVGNLFFTVALTSKGKLDNKFYHKLKTGFFNDDNKKYEDSSFCILSQVKVMDKKRFTEKMGYVKTSEFIEIKEKLKDLIL